MPSKPIRAIAEAGELRLLEPVNLQEGEEVWIVILPQDEDVPVSSADLLTQSGSVSTDEIDEAD